MEQKLLVDHYEFWKDSNIIYCKILDGFNKNNSGKDLNYLFSNTISVLSENNFMPIIIILNTRNIFHSLKLFKFFSENYELGRVVLSKNFLVRSYLQKLVLTIYAYKIDAFNPDTIFNDREKAITNCTKKYEFFNSIN